MQPIMQVAGLSKRYPAFSLTDLSFVLNPGITGLIGPNGAGKTTLLRCLLDLVHPDSGEVAFFGVPYASDPRGIRQRIGFASGSAPFYPRKSLKVLTEAASRFYRNWDWEVFRELARRFFLDENKTPEMLSSGMGVKYSLALALSHHAELLILDEPMSGLDPASRAEIEEIVLELWENQRVSVLFSTHLTAELEDCANRILYLSGGRLEADEELSAYLNRFRLMRTDRPPNDIDSVLGYRRVRGGWVALLPASAKICGNAACQPANLSEIMVLKGRVS